MDSCEKKRTQEVAMAKREGKRAEAHRAEASIADIGATMTK